MSAYLKSIQAATIGAKKQFKRYSLEFDGNTVEFIQPTVKQRRDLLSKCKDTKGEVDGVLLMVEAVIALTVEPNTENRVFDDTSRDSIMSQPSGGWFEQFAEKAIQALTGSDDPKDVAALGNEPEA